jgi:hypothetical protein
MAPGPQFPSNVSDSLDGRRAERTNQIWDQLGQTVTYRRRAPALSRPQTHDDWDTMIRAHQAIQRNIESTGTVTDQLIEGLRFDLDILKHAFGRWAFRVDQRF